MKGRKLSRDELKVGMTVIGGDGISSCWKYNREIVPFIITEISGEFVYRQTPDGKGVDSNPNSSCFCEDLNNLYEWITEEEPSLTYNAPNIITKLMSFAKRLLSKDLNTLVEVGYLDSSLNLTIEGRAELEALLFEEKKVELVKLAEEELKSIKTK